MLHRFSALFNSGYVQHQAVQLLRDKGIAVPVTIVAESARGAKEAADKIFNEEKCPVVAVKAQVLSGGRAKGVFQKGFAGGVHIAENSEQAEKIACQMLGDRLVTRQSGPEGKPCDSVMIASGVPLDSLYYLAILLDRESRGPVLIGCAEGGVDIEEVAKRNYSAIKKLPLPIDGSLSQKEAMSFANGIGLGSAGTALQAATIIQSLYSLFREFEATLVEVNPLDKLKSGNLLCLDAKMTFDENSLFRQPKIAAMRDTRQEDPREVMATQAHLNYIGLDGNIGCLVNGAGLAMATMDLIKLHGGEPANFLDVGGSATSEQVAEAFRILTKDQRVECIFVNIFGGIMKCEIIAEGIIRAMQTLNLSIPVIARLQGTNYELAAKMIEQSKLPIFSSPSLEDAAVMAVRKTKQKK